MAELKLSKAAERHTSSLSHEMRTPLHTVDFFLQKFEKYLQNEKMQTKAAKSEVKGHVKLM